MKTKIATATAALCTTLSASLAQVNVQVPVSYGSNQDQIAQQGINISGDSNVWISILQLVNSYLWVLLVVAIMVVLIVTGFKLMSGNNDNTGKALMNGLIGVAIAIFSYAIIRLVINLF